MNPKTLKEHLLSLNEAAGTVKIKGFHFFIGDFPVKEIDANDLDNAKYNIKSNNIVLLVCKQIGDYRYEFDEDVFINVDNGDVVLLFISDKDANKFGAGTKIEVTSSAPYYMFPGAKVETIDLRPVQKDSDVKNFIKDIFGKTNINVMLGWIKQ